MTRQLDAAYERIWKQFRADRRLADGRHDTADWRGHEGVFAGCVIRVPAAALQPSLDEFRRVLAAFPFVRIHPDGFLHVMLQELGFVCPKPERQDEIAPARFDEFVTAASGAIPGVGPFELTLGGANSFDDAAFLEVHDDGCCARLHTRLRELAAIPKPPKFAYLPHVTIAHYTADAPADGLPAAIAPWYNHRFGAFTVTEIEIVTLRLAEPYPPLEPYAIIPLEG